MQLPNPRLAIFSLVIIGTILVSGLALALKTPKATHPVKQATHTTTAPKASPAKLAADKAAYKASAAKEAQLEQAYNQAKQAEQAALDQYGDGSPEYQAAKNATTNASTTLAGQLNDAISKSLQVQIDGGTTSN